MPPDRSGSDRSTPAGSGPDQHGPDRRAYLFGLAPAAVVVVVGPALALGLPPLVVLPVPGPLVALQPLGVPLVAAGLGLAVWAVHAFARAGEPPSHTCEPGVLVTDGPLAHTRNPVYLGTVLAALGEAVLFGSALLAGYALGLWAVYHALVVYREEPELRDAVGPAYDDYRERVPRWV